VVYRIILIVLLFGASIQYSYSQTYNAKTICSSILEELNIPDTMYYDDIESAFSENELSITVRKHVNVYDSNLRDFSYDLYFNSYRITIYKSATSEKYFVTGVEIDIAKNRKIKLLFKYQTIEQFRTHKDFGNIIDGWSSDSELVYEIAKEWDYLTVYFYNANIYKILLTFRLEGIGTPIEVSD
jgi:hypothetical protein